MTFIKKNLIKLIVSVLGVIALIIIVVSLISGSSKPEKANENGLVNAAKKYYEKRPEFLPQVEYDTSQLFASVLISEKYMENFKDENENILNCNSYVTVTKIKNNYYYYPVINCNKDFDTKLLFNSLLNDLVETGDGLYSVGNEYIYRGEYPNNYVYFAEKEWRIIKIDELGNIKLMLTPNYIKSTKWDDRYNIKTNKNSGINDFKISRIYYYLQEQLNNEEFLPEENLSKMAKTNLCIGKRSEKDITKNGNTECSKKLNDQMIGLIQTNEYLFASLDKNCLEKDLKTCRNYNYLATTGYWTMNGLKEDNSKVFMTDSYSSIKTIDARYSIGVLPVINLKSNVIISEGNGSKENPYIIK